MTTQIFEPQGEYAQIETQTAIHAAKVILHSTNEEEKQKMIEEVKKEPSKYAPTVFCALSAALMAQNKPEEAAFWFYAGQLRARYDAMRCADETAGEAVSVLNMQFGPAVNQYMFKHIDALKKLIPKVIEFDRKTPHNYDHRWINLHGMGAFTGNTGMSVPQEKWAEIEETARENYLSGFNEAMSQLPQTS
eukprot:Phypoly_transcript_17520.p1 GENE.Phypoly_transcript_17520~~Phypoly_transcript_17520.p1  ORF type:complete len:199 (+),score=42.25 Phypoly_transcript_17520:25-597(+)